MAKINGEFILLWDSDTKIVKMKSNTGTSVVYWNDQYYVGTSIEDLDNKILELGLIEIESRV